MTLAMIVLCMNILWLGAAVLYFCLRSVSTSRLLVPEGATNENGRQAVAGAIRFLGGMNLSLLVLSVLTLVLIDHFTYRLLIAPIGALMVGHGTQFLVNLPTALREFRGKTGVWPVLRSKSMCMIFVTDFLLMAANALLLGQLLLTL